jgi:hypothetical protein
MTSSVSVMSQPIFTMWSEPQHEQLVGASITTRSRGKCAGKDLIEDRLRANIRGTIDAVFDEELKGFLGREGLSPRQTGSPDHWDIWGRDNQRATRSH